MKIKFFFVLIVCCLLSGCISITSPVMHDKGFPPNEKFEILGQAGESGIRYIILGIFQWGGIEYSDLSNAAYLKYRATDDVVNVTLDSKIISVLGIFTRIEYFLSGTAIKYVKEPAVTE